MKVYEMMKSIKWHADVSAPESAEQTEDGAMVLDQDRFHVSGQFLQSDQRKPLQGALVSTSRAVHRRRAPAAATGFPGNVPGTQFLPRSPPSVVVIVTQVNHLQADSSFVESDDITSLRRRHGCKSVTVLQVALVVQLGLAHRGGSAAAERRYRDDRQLLVPQPRRRRFAVSQGGGVSLVM